MSYTHVLIYRSHGGTIKSQLLCASARVDAVLWSKGFIESLNRKKDGNVIVSLHELGHPTYTG
jgi:hypothetical protein